MSKFGRPTTRPSLGAASLLATPARGACSLCGVGPGAKPSGLPDHPVRPPDWDSAPNWAEYRAQDLCGDWYWYAEKPILRTDSNSYSWYSPARFQFHSNRETVAPWKQTREKRPEEDDE